MLSARRMLSKARESGRPLPSLAPLRDLEHGHFKFRFYRGQTTVIAGEPGAQKSGLATWLVSQWNVPTLYFAADTDPRTSLARLLAALSGDQTNHIKAAFDTGNDAFYDEFIDATPVRFVTRSEPAWQDILDELDAWVEALDSWPSVIVLDNMLDIEPPYGDGSEHGGYKAILLECKKLARVTGAAILVLHHMSENEDSDARKRKPPKRARLMGKAAQTPECVLSLGLYDDELLICPVKNRNGPQDKTAERFERLRVHPERNGFSRWTSLDDQVNATKQFWDMVSNDG